MISSRFDTCSRALNWLQVRWQMTLPPSSQLELPVFTKEVDRQKVQTLMAL